VIHLLRDLQHSVMSKVLFIGALILLLLVPLGMIEGLIRERRQHFEAARADVANAWGAAQVVGGPILVVPFRFTRSGLTEPLIVTDELYVLPEALEIAGVVTTEERKRGIYGVPVYTARLEMTGRFPEPAFDGSGYEDLEMLWDQAQIALPLTDARSVLEPLVLSSGDSSVTFEAGHERVKGFGPQLLARYAELGLGALAAPQAFSVALEFRGTGALDFLPLGDETRVSISSNWPSPSFAGTHLPSRRDVTTEGFSAEWRVLDLGRGYPARWRATQGSPLAVGASVFGAALVTPVGLHEATLRATKYGLLIVGLTFAAYFMFELFAALRLHALQYLLIGLANCLFYLLLLALSEHVGFVGAYATSAGAATALVTSYSAAALRSYGRALQIGALLAGLYTYLYVTLRAEDFALLIGAVGAFAALAAFMYVTRRVDWFAVRFAAERPPRGSGTAGPADP
jgi:inner membrane protein